MRQGRRAAPTADPAIAGRRPYRGGSIRKSILRDALKFSRVVSEPSRAAPSRAARRAAGRAVRRLSGTMARATEFAVAFVILAGMVPALSETNHLDGINPSNSLPATLVLADGHSYRNPNLLEAAPDGIVIEYALIGGGTGVAKIKFPNLPETLQKQFGYDRQRAAAFEADQRRAMDAFVRKHAEAEKTRGKTQAESSRKSGTVVVHVSPPKTEYTFYSTSSPRPQALTDPWLAGTEKHFFCQAQPL